MDNFSLHKYFRDQYLKENLHTFTYKLLNKNDEIVSIEALNFDEAGDIMRSKYGGSDPVLLNLDGKEVNFKPKPIRRVKMHETELPKDKWVDLDNEGKEEFKKRIFDLIDSAYAYIGGHVNYKSPDDVTGSEGDADYEVIDLDDDEEPDAVDVSKQGAGGKKLVATGHDGSPEAKKAVINHKVDQLNHKGFYIEVSGKIKDILIGKGAPIVKDEVLIRRVLKGKEITDFNPEDGSYTRVIAGEPHEKVMLGKPNG